MRPERLFLLKQSLIPRYLPLHPLWGAPENRPVSVPEERPITKPIPPAYTAKPKVSFEQHLGAKLPVWIGGIALALAGLFMVKYSIETGLLSPTVRLVIGGIFGVGLLFSGNWIRNKADIANGTRIAQALSGAGIADLYACLFAASSIYHLLPSFIGFIGMAAVTAVAVTLSLRHGAPIALLGLIGGFLTPALVGSSEPNAPLLFVYLYFVLTGLFTVIRKKNWWLLSIPTVIGAFLWIVVWLVTGFTSPDGIWLGLFLIAVSTTVVVSSKKAMEEGLADVSDAFALPATLNYLTLGGAVVLMGIIAMKTDFSGIEWGLFGLLAAGGIVLAHFNQKLYGFVPWLSMVVNAVMLAAWHNTDATTLAFTLAAFASLYAVSGYWLMWRSQSSDSAPVSWAALAGGSSLLYYLLGYAELHNWLEVNFVSSAPWLAEKPLWGILALGLSCIAVTIVKQVLEQYQGNEATKQKLLAIFTLATTAFLSIGLTVELNREFLSVVFAAEILAVSWINTRLDIKAMRPIAGVLACVFGVILMPQILLLVQVATYSLLEARLYLQNGIPIVNWPLFQLGLPAVMFAGSSVLLRQQKDDRLIAIFELTAVSLIAIMGYYLTRHIFHVGENVLFTKAGFTERGVITNVIFLYGLACFWTGRQFERPTISFGGFVLSAIALFRIAYFDLFIHNPVWSHQLVGSLPVLNALLLAYGLPIIWLMRANARLYDIGKESYLRYTQPFLLVLAFALVSFNVRQFYHGEYLDDGITSNAEIYTYSAAWLLMGIGLLFFGTLRDDKTIRLASLAIMILTVGKVFLYDASELTGLLRVFSFLGLGLSLLGLSWFYARFVSESKITQD